MLRIGDDNSIQLTRGDTAYLQVPIYNDVTGEEYEMAKDDKLTFSVKRNINDTEYCFQKELVGSNIFKIEPDDTKRYDFASYKYDVQLTTASGDVYTVIAPAVFKICTEVT